MNSLGTLKKSALFIPVILTVGCAIETPDSRHFTQPNNSTFKSAHIIGGTESNQEFQNQNGLVGLLITEEFDEDMFTTNVIQSTCTGTLIERNIVLTAAHCLIPKNKGARLRTLAFFTTNKKGIKNRNSVYARSVHLHHDFIQDSAKRSKVSGNRNDLAIIKLRKNAPEEVQLAKLITNRTEVILQDQSTLTLAGYGVTNPIVREIIMNRRTGKQEIIELKNTGDGILRQVSDVPVTSIDTENKEIHIDHRTDQEGIYKGTCHGDSGGPAFVSTNDGLLVQVGIASRVTDRLGNCDTGAIYTSIEGHEKWINDLVTELSK